MSIKDNTTALQELLRKANSLPEAGSTITVDQTYSPESENPQSGIAVAEAIKSIIITIEGYEQTGEYINITEQAEIIEKTYAYGTIGSNIATMSGDSYSWACYVYQLGAGKYRVTGSNSSTVDGGVLTDENGIVVGFVGKKEEAPSATSPFEDYFTINNGESCMLYLNGLPKFADFCQSIYQMDASDLNFVRKETTTETTTGVPDYVVAEGKEVADKVIAKRTINSLVLLMGSDIHMVDNDTTKDAILHMAQGMEQIREYVTPDAVVLLGDYVYDTAPASKEQGIEDIKRVRKYLNNAISDTPVVYMNGNHDTYNTSGDNRIGDNEVYALIGSHNKHTIVDTDNVGGNYGYIDFEKQKIRVIYLNTTDINGGINSSNFISNIQGAWLVNTALDLSSKGDEEEKWGVVVCSHFPIFAPAFADLLAVLTAYKNKSSGTNYGTSYDFSTAKAELIVTFHGHIHNFKVTTVNGIKCICIPNAYPDRQNPYVTNPDFAEVDENGNPVYYNKTAGTAEDTSFNAVVIDRDSKTVHAIAYGAGYDRVIPYGEIQPTYTNQIPISTDASGAVYNGVGYKENTRLNSSAVEKEYSGICCTGFIPFVKQEDGYTWIYFKNCRIDVTKDSNGYQEIAFFRADKTLIRKAYVGSIYVASPEACTVEGNYLTSIQLYDDAAFIRITGDYIGADSIITINEPIE